MELEFLTVDGENHTLECDAALFDADGTIYEGYENGAVEEARRKALKAFGFVEPPFENLRGLAGNHALLAIKRAQKLNDRERLEREWPRVLEAFRERLRMPEVLTPLPDAHALLSGFNEVGVPTGIATNSSRENWDLKAGKLPEGIMGQIKVVVTMTCVGGKPKPYPDMLIEGARRLNVQSPVFFGDSNVDARAARNAGMPSLIRRAGRTQEQLRGLQSGGAWIVEDFFQVRVRP